MWQWAFAFFDVCAVAIVGVIRAFENVPIATRHALGTEAKSCKGTADRCIERDINMGIGACSLCAVASQEVSACRHSFVCWLVGEVAVGACRTSLVQEVLANGDLFWVVRKSARGSVGAFTYKSCQYSRGLLTGVPYATRDPVVVRMCAADVEMLGVIGTVFREVFALRFRLRVIGSVPQSEYWCHVCIIIWSKYLFP